MLIKTKITMEVSQVLKEQKDVENFTVATEPTIKYETQMVLDSMEIKIEPIKIESCFLPEHNDSDQKFKLIEEAKVISDNDEHMIVIDLLPHNMVNKKTTTTERRRKQSGASMKRMREKIKSDPTKYEEYKRKERERYFQRRKSGKIKTITEMNEGQKRAKREDWKESGRRYRMAKKEAERREEMLGANTPPHSPSSPNSRLLETSVNRSYNTPSRQETNEAKLKKENRNLKAQVIKLRRRVNKYRKRAERVAKILKKSVSPSHSSEVSSD